VRLLSTLGSRSRNRHPLASRVGEHREADTSHEVLSGRPMPSSYLVLREGLTSVRDRSGIDVVVQADDATELLGVVRDSNLSSPSSTSGCRRHAPPRALMQPG
jgi:hypothetical protein